MPKKLDTLLSSDDPLDVFVLDRLRRAKSQGEALTIADLARDLDLPVAGERHRLVGAVAVHALTDRLAKLVTSSQVATKTANGEQFYYIPDAPPAAATTPAKPA